MTERERYNTRGMYSRLTGDYQQCVKEYGELIARYEADVVGRNRLALCLTKLRRFPEAVTQMRRVVRLLPTLPLFRTNLSYYATYASDFQTAEQEALAIQPPDRFAGQALAFAQLGQGRVADAARILQEGAAADVAANYTERAAMKFALLSQVHLNLDNNRAAVAAADQALMRSRAVPIRFLAARTFVKTGNTSRARQEAMTLANELEAEPQAYAK